MREAATHSPAVLDVLVDAASDEHCEEGVVPGADEHQGEAETHPEEGEGPNEQSTAPNWHLKLLHKLHLPHHESLPCNSTSASTLGNQACHSVIPKI